MPKKEFTIVNALLLALEVVATPLMMLSPYELRDRFLFGKNYNSYRNIVYNLQKRGSIKVTEKNGRKFLQLTKKGRLEILLAKAKMPVTKKWDGKWRMIVFDIPEWAKPQRNQLRGLLKKNNFYRLQDSVYVNPYPLNREAIKYLSETGLSEYIRIIKVEEMDNDKDLKKKFGLV
jgi:phenylacetic acid degradation operon negative regulatory protein